MPDSNINTIEEQGKMQVEGGNKIPSESFVTETYPVETAGKTFTTDEIELPTQANFVNSTDLPKEGNVSQTNEVPSRMLTKGEGYDANIDQIRGGEETNPALPVLADYIDQVPISKY